jgi:hypothetical protein
VGEVIGYRVGLVEDIETSGLLVFLVLLGERSGRSSSVHVRVSPLQPTSLHLAPLHVGTERHLCGTLDCVTAKERAHVYNGVLGVQRILIDSELMCQPYEQLVV